MKLVILRLFLLCWILLFCPSALLMAQDKDPLFEPLPHNLHNNSVRCILRDSKGYMWFGTSDGLARYDGVNFYVYENDPDDKRSIDHNSINAMVEDDKQNLWVGTSGGVNLYNRETDNFIHIDIYERNQPKITYISALYADNDGRIWIGTLGRGLIIYNPQTKAFELFANNPDDNNSISSDNVTRIGKDSGNNVWVGTRNGLNLFSQATQNFSRFFNKADNTSRLCHNHVTSLTTDAKGNFWVGTRGGGLNKITNKENTFVFEHYVSDPQNPGSLSNNVILSLWADKNGFLWIGTENGGLNRLDVSDNSIARFYNEEGNPYSISGNSIWSLYGDEEDILWIGVYGKGINVVNRKNRKFELYQRNPFVKNGLADNDVRAFAKDANGDIWIATDGGGLTRFDPKTHQFTKTINNSGDRHQISTNAVMALLYDSKQNLWIGTWSGGIDRVSKTGAIKNYQIRGNQEVGTNNVLSLYEDSYENIWAGSAGSGLFLYDHVSDKFIQFTSTDSSIPSDGAFITSITEDKNRKIWVGTLYGLVSLNRRQDEKYEGNIVYHTDAYGSISSNAIEIVYHDSKQRLWIGTADKGLNLLNSDGTFTIYQKKNGLSGNAIRAIMEDKKGNLWISTNKGLTRFDPVSGKFRNFTKEDGLNSNEFYPRSCIQTGDGEIYFGGKNGFNTFYPDKVQDNLYVPPVYITDLKIYGKPVLIGAAGSPLKKHISATADITLTHEQTSFAIDFVALNYTHSLRNKYAYKLEGFDNEWHYAGNKLSATYTNIDPGTYTFLVKGSNNDDVWNETPASLSLTINPPLWKTWWAILSYIIFSSAVVLIIIRIRYEKIQVKNQLKLERMAREKEHELTQLKMQFFTNISHEFRTPLSLIIGPLESLISSSDVKVREQLSVTYRNARRMMRLVNELMEFRKLDEGKVKLRVECVEIAGFISAAAESFTEISKKRNISFTVDAEVPCFHGWIDRDKIETVIANLLGNAFKFVNDNGKVTISIRVSGEIKNEINGDDRFLELVVTDNGIGIGAQELPFIFEKFYQAKSAEIKKTSGTGIGLALVKGLVELHHGTITVQSIPNYETRFTVKLPIDKHAYSEDDFSAAYCFPPEPEKKSEAINDSDEEKNTDNGAKSRILIVEDNDELRNYLAGELGKNFLVTQAADGDKGLEAALNTMPDLIVSDIVMPGKSGIELCSSLKSDIRTSHIPIILLTARTTIEDQIEGIGKGADAYLPKPFNIRLLKTQIKQLIEVRRKLYVMFSQNVYMMPAKITGNEIDRAFLQNAIDYIIQNITDPQLNVEALADEFKISKSQMYRKIKALTGKTAVEFVRTVRLKQALKLMETKRYTLAEVAYQTGFTSPSYFTKSFREQYGKAPSEYLERNGHYQNSV